MDAAFVLVFLVEDLEIRWPPEAIEVPVALDEYIERLSRRLGATSVDVREEIASLQDRGLIDILQGDSTSGFQVKFLSGVQDDLSRLARVTTDAEAAQRARVQADRFAGLQRGSMAVDGPKSWWGESRPELPSLVRAATPDGDIQFVDDNQVARDDKLDELLRHLQDQHVIALVGQPGVGKTHLVAQLVHHLETVPGTGLKLVWAKLTEDFDFEQLLIVIRMSLDSEVQFQTAPLHAADYAESMASAALQILRNHTCLLILDGYEKALDPVTNQPTDPGVREFLGKLLQHSSRMSRTILVSWWLPCDSSRRSPPFVLLEGFSFSEARELLQLRARENVSDDVLHAILERTEGNPLAIEVLAGGFAPGSRVAPTTAGAIREACNRLDPESQALLSAVAIAEDVVEEVYLVHVGKHALGLKTVDVIGRLEDLKNFKLLIKSAWDESRGERVYWLHSLVREQLLSMPGPTVDLERLDRVAMDYWMQKAGRRGNRTIALKTALRYARRCGDGNTTIKILHEFGLGQKLIREGNFAEVGETLEQLFDYSAGDTLVTPEDLGLAVGTNAETITELVGLLAESYFKRGRFGDATSLIEWLIDHGRGSVMHRCLLAQMMASTDEVHLAEAVALDALAAVDTRRDDSGRLAALGLLGFIYSQVGSATKALESYAQALALSKQLNDLASEALTESRIGLVLWVSGDIVSAGRHFQRGFDLARKVRDPYLVGLATGNLGHYYQDKPDRTAKDLQIAEGHYRRALDIHERTGVRRGQGYWHGQLGRIELAHGNTEDALTHLRRALLIHRAIGERAAMARHLWYLGLVHAFMGDVAARNGWLSLALDELEYTHNFVELEVRKREADEFGYALNSDDFDLGEIRDDYTAFLDGESSFGVRSFLHWVHSTEFSPV